MKRGKMFYGWTFKTYTKTYISTIFEAFSDYFLAKTFGSSDFLATFAADKHFV